VREYQLGTDLVSGSSGVELCPNLKVSAASFPPLQHTQGRGSHGVAVLTSSKDDHSLREGGPPALLSATCG